MYVFMSMCEPIHVHAVSLGSQKRVSECMEFEVVMDNMKYVLRTELRFSRSSERKCCNH